MQEKEMDVMGKEEWIEKKYKSFLKERIRSGRNTQRS